jgi:hypothetical protein
MIMKTIKIKIAVLFAVVMMGVSSMVNAQDAAKPVSGIAFNSTTIDFQKIEQGKPVTAEFDFTNPSMVPLIINSVSTSCGCTVADYPKEPVQPGKSGKIKVTFNAAATGPFTKTITVASNTSEGRSILNIKGEVMAKN